MLYNILLIVQIIISIAMIGLILVQHGKGADAGAAFGSGSSGTVFGSQGSANFLSRTTAILATAFFINSLALAWLVANRTMVAPSSLMDRVQQTAPAAPALPSDVPALPVDGNGAPAVLESVPSDTVQQAAPAELAPVEQQPSLNGVPAAPEAPVE